MNCPQPIPVRLGSERVQLICAVDEMTDADYDAQTVAAAVLLPLLEGPS